jgi:4-hydroxyphenylpyruvate dioxygenase-like putative hemolysin
MIFTSHDDSYGNFSKDHTGFRDDGWKRTLEVDRHSQTEVRIVVSLERDSCPKCQEGYENHGSGFFLNQKQLKKLIKHLQTFVQ